MIFLALDWTIGARHGFLLNGELDAPGWFYD
jgi:hypothetical protein